MTNKVRTHMVNDTAPQPRLAPSEIVKQEFGKRLYRLLLEKQWNQSELARRANIKRDSVSTYIRGMVLPTPANLQAIAAALDVDPSELMPMHNESAIERDVPSMEMKISSSAPDTAWLRINRAVSVTTALKVMEILNADDVAARK